MIYADIVINRGYTESDIIIDGLTRYYDLDSRDFTPSAMVLKTNSSVVPYVILLDCSVDKKDSAVLKLRSACGKMSSSMIIPVKASEMSLIASMGKCVLHTATGASYHNFKLSCKADVIAYSCFPVDESMTLQTTISEDTSHRIYIDLCGSKVFSLDDMYLWELDPLTLSEIDRYGLGTGLVTAIDSISTEFYISDSVEIATGLDSSLDIEVSPPVANFDNYLLMHLDPYTIGDLCEYNI